MWLRESRAQVLTSLNRNTRTAHIPSEAIASLRKSFNKAEFLLLKAKCFSTVWDSIQTRREMALSSWIAADTNMGSILKCHRVERSCYNTYFYRWETQNHGVTMSKYQLLSVKHTMLRSQGLYCTSVRLLADSGVNRLGFRARFVTPYCAVLEKLIKLSSVSSCVQWNNNNNSHNN